MKMRDPYSPRKRRELVSTMSIMKTTRREPGFPVEATPQQNAPLSAILQRAASAPDTSSEAREHLTRVDAITSRALKDLQTVADDVSKLRDEIALRGRMVAEATVRLDELQRKAGKGYVTIRNALDLVRKEFGLIPPAEPVRESPTITAPPEGDQSAEDDTSETLEP